MSNFPGVWLMFLIDLFAGEYIINKEYDGMFKQQNNFVDVWDLILLTLSYPVSAVNLCAFLITQNWIQTAFNPAMKPIGDLSEIDLLCIISKN